MTTRHWQASYASIPKEINPDAQRSVLPALPIAFLGEFTAAHSTEVS